ncbi:hypothetical protein BUALT_Bualt01G0208000 [Buddleja alternifolia]|uniref:Uncharacterized protein n=1 Tax=Buddleja alternifolia TaxID=168488 RepID=A0AAV6YFA6_9LAMI|nr:hypothetical protein BUALT_Bualt01G0208000 [Buddleja alternifolia]
MTQSKIQQSHSKPHPTPPTISYQQLSPSSPTLNHKTPIFSPSSPTFKPNTIATKAPVHLPPQPRRRRSPPQHHSSATSPTHLAIEPLCTPPYPVRRNSHLPQATAAAAAPVRLPPQRCHRRLSLSLSLKATERPSKFTPLQLRFHLSPSLAGLSWLQFKHKGPFPPRVLGPLDPSSRRNVILALTVNGGVMCITIPDRHTGKGLT